MVTVTDIYCRKIQGGVAYYPLKNRVNIKAGYGRLLETGKPGLDQFIVQTQLSFY